MEAWLRGSGPPYPARERKGTLDLTGDEIVWRTRSGTRIPISLFVARSSTVAMGEYVVGVRLQGVDPSGTRLELRVGVADAPAVREALREETAGRRPLGRPRGERRLVWVGAPLGLVVAGVLLAVGLVVLLVTGRDVDARVVRVDDESGCTVEWSERGRVERSDVDCNVNDAEVGDVVRVRALAGPFRGEAVDGALTRAVLVFGAGGLVGAGGLMVGWRLASDAIARRRYPTIDDVEVRGLPVVQATDLRYATVAAASRARGRAEGWAGGDGRITRSWSLSSRERVKRLVGGPGGRARSRRVVADPDGRRDVRYVLVVDHGGNPAMVLYDRREDHFPIGVIPAPRPFRGAAAVAGDASVIAGTVVPGEVVELAIDGQSIGREVVEPPDVGLVLGLVNADVVSDIE